FRSPEQPESKSASRERHNAALAGGGENERANSATTNQNRCNRRSSGKSRSSPRTGRERKSRSQRQTRRQPAGNCSVKPTRGGSELESVRAPRSSRGRP